MINVIFLCCITVDGFSVKQHQSKSCDEYVIVGGTRLPSIAESRPFGRKILAYLSKNGIKDANEVFAMASCSVYVKRKNLERARKVLARSDRGFPFELEKPKVPSSLSK